MSRRVLIIGGDSVVGAALACELRIAGVEVITTTRRPDAGDRSALRLDLSETVSRWPLPQCDTAVLCAAMGSLTACQSDPAGTRRINVEHSSILCQRLMEAGALTVMLSSNMVYNGLVPLVASNALPSPVTEYGRQKAELEGVLLSEPQKAVVLRLTKVLHPELPLLKRWTAAMTAGKSVEAFADYFCSPIILSTVIRGLLQIISQRLGGVWQFSAPDQVSYAEIAHHLSISLGASQSLVRESACGTGIEHVPRHTTLDVSRAHAELDLDFEPAAVTLTKLFAR